MTSVESRIVTMKFDNVEFERNVGKTMGTLDRLKGVLSFSGMKTGLSGIAATIGKFNPRNMFANSQKGITDLQDSTNKFSTGSMTGSVTGISKSFIAMSTIAITALSNIAGKAVNAGINIGKALTIDSKKAGFAEYELKMGSIQTIMSGSGASLKTVNKYLQDLNTYSDKTIYSFADMTSNIGKFTNAGVNLKTAVGAIKGVSNVAAISGANAEEASRAMYNFSQAISSGSVKLMDWKSIELANMATKGFKTQLLDGAVAAGTLKKGVGGAYKTLKGTPISATKGFNASLSQEWLTSKVLTKTLTKYADKHTDIGKKAFAAAEDVKTFSQMIDTLKETAGSGWSQSFELIFGNFNQAKKLFTGLNTTIGGIIQSSSKARNKILAGWNKRGGRVVLIEGITNAFHALIAVIKPIKDAFREVFPKKTGKDLYDLTVKFRDFTEKLKMGKGSADKIHRTFKGFFSVLSIGVSIVKGIAHYVATFFGLFAGSGGSGSILTMTASIGDLLVQLDKWLKTGDRVGHFFDGLIEARATILGPIIAFVGTLVKAFAALIKGGPDAFMAALQVSFNALSPVLDGVRQAFGNVFGALGDSLSKLSPMVGGLGSVLGGIAAFAGGMASKLGDAFNIGDATSVATASVVGVKGAMKSTVGVANQVKSAWQSVVDAFAGIGRFFAPILPTIKSIFSELKTKFSDFFKGMGIQDGLAVINTGFFISLYILARKFVKSMKSVFDNLSETFDNMNGVFKQATANLKTMQTSIRANILLKIAASIALLAAALLILSKIDVANLGKALAAVAILLGMLVLTLKKLEKGAKTTGSLQLTLLSVAMVALSVAVIALAGAVAILGRMNLKTLAKGITSVGSLLGIVVGFTAVLSKTGGAGQILVASAAMVVLAAALMAMAGVVKTFGGMDTGGVVEGVTKVVGVLVALSFAMTGMPKYMLRNAVALGIISLALVSLAGTIKLLSSMDTGGFIEGMAKIAAVLVTLGLALQFIQTTLKGALAIFIIAAALTAMLIPITALSTIPFWDLIKALLAMALMFTIIGVAGSVLAPVIPFIYALGIAIGMIGLGLLAVGGGLFLFATGLAVLAASGSAGIAILTAAVISLAQLFPLIMQQIGLGLIALAKVMITAGPPLMKAFTVVLKALCQAAINVAPKLGEALIVLIRTGLRVLRKSFPDFVETGYQLLLSLLRGFLKHIGEITELTGKIIAKFLTSLAKQLPKIIDAGFKLIISFINGLSKAIDKNMMPLLRAGRRLAWSLLSGFVKGILGGAIKVAKAAWNMAKGALSAAWNAIRGKSPSKEFAKVGVSSGQGLVIGLNSHAKKVNQASADVAESALNTMKTVMSSVGDVLSADMDVSPVIAPVLDLTQVQAGASKIGGLIGDKTLMTDVSYGQASAISTQQQADQAAAAAAVVTPVVPPVQEVKFEQNNYSPKSLSPVEIYRQTRNQLSLAKEALNA